MTVPLADVVRGGLHLLLALGLFLVVNWVGSRSKPFGYTSLRLLPQADDAPAFNVLLRTGAPLAYLLLASAALYGVGWDPMVRGVWHVVAYYFAGRAALNLWLGRRLRVNWTREIGQAALATGVAWLLYDRVIQFRETLLPDAKTVAAELWVIVALFVYSLLNGIRLGTASAERRARRYVADAYARYVRQYGHLVSAGVPAQENRPDPLAESSVYSVMIHEGFNRPPRVQRLERVLQRLSPGRPRTLGPMQVRTLISLTDDESVRLGVERIARVYRGVIDGVPAVEGAPAVLATWEVVQAVARDYNRDDNYVRDVAGVHELVVEAAYPSLNTSEAASGVTGLM